MAENQMQFNSDYVYESSRRFEKIGIDAVEQMMNCSTKNRPAALIAAYDEVAMGRFMH